MSTFKLEWLIHPLCAQTTIWNLFFFLLRSTSTRYYCPVRKTDPFVAHLKTKIFLHIFVTKRLHNKIPTDLKPHSNFVLKKGFHSEYNCSDLAVHVPFFMINKNDAAKENKDPKSLISKIYFNKIYHSIVVDQSYMNVSRRAAP